MEAWPENTVQPGTFSAKSSQVAPKYDLIRYRIRPVGDFLGTDGKPVPLYGCSFADLDEFLNRVEYLRSQVQQSPDDMSLEELMVADPMFRYSAERCLEMHGLSFKQVGLRQMVDLLLYEVVDGELQPGLLVRLNMPRNQEEIDAATSAALGIDPAQASYERALAIMSSHTNSVAEAIDLTHRLTVAQLTDLMTESAKIAKAASGAGGAPKNLKDLTKYLDTEISESMLYDGPL